MTGKKRKNSKSYWVEDTPEKLSYICETLHEENMQLKDELTKYKRAFEILKEKNFVPFYRCNACDQENTMEYYFGGVYQTCKITKEEYELLEELMKSENS